MTTRLPRPLLVCLGLLLFVRTVAVSQESPPPGQSEPDLHERTHEPDKEMAMNVQYLEIVTPEMDATCDALEKIHGVSFSKPDAALGNARTAALDGGGRISVRAPMRETEEPVVRPYIRVDDLEAAVEAARAAGGEIAFPSMEIPGHGTIAIYILGGIEHGLWQR